MLEDLSTFELALVGLCFVWGGFVRSGLGFGGSVLTLPFLLLILNAPLVFLPITAMHLLVFSALTVVQAHWRHHRLAASNSSEGGKTDTIDWAFLRAALPVMIVPKLLGVAGVLVLPADVVSAAILCVVGFYSLAYLLNRPIKSRGGWYDRVLLAIGGYVSGTSLIAAPLVVPVAASRMPAYRLRDTLMVLWFVLVSIKLAAFIASGVDLQLRHHLWLLPCAGVGHVLGLKFHRYSLHADTATFMRWVGGGLFLVTVAGLVNLL